MLHSQNHTKRKDYNRIVIYHISRNSTLHDGTKQVTIDNQHTLK